MRHDLLHLLKCPLTKTPLRFELITEFAKQYEDGPLTEIKDGLLFSETGFVFPIINGIPRMLIESVYDYGDFFQKYYSGYKEILAQLEKNYKGVLDYCKRKNTRTKKSFEFEWNFLNVKKKDKIWGNDVSQLAEVYSSETGLELEKQKDKTVIDIGSGHGYITMMAANYTKLSIGVELSKAVENAYLHNNKRNAFFIQGDLQYLPFDEKSFDILYSSGVIHHTNNTELSLSLIEPVLKTNGRICLWLYHPQQKLFHSLTLAARAITRKLPLKLVFVLVAIFIFPFTYLLKKIKNKHSPNYREEMINLLDSFTPEYRFEVTHDVAQAWLSKRNYVGIKITTTNQFGFSIVGNKL